MKKSERKYWIKERRNPQLGIYYIALGQLSKTKARAHLAALYGTNVLECFDSKEEYDSKLSELRKRGASIQ